MTATAPKRTIETADYAAMLSRMIRAYGRRVADADDVDLATMMQLRRQLDQAIVDAIGGQRDRGVSWAGIGAGLGMTRQGAEQWTSRTVASLQSAK